MDAIRTTAWWWNNRTMLAKIRDKLIYEAEGVAVLAKFVVSSDEVMDRPSRSMPSMTIETTNICNANCVFCGYQFQQRPTGVMAEPLFRKLVTEFAECGGGGLSLTPTVGDPLVDPDIADRIAWAKAVPGITRVGMYSNMISLGRIGADRLIASGLAMQLAQKQKARQLIELTG